MGRQVHFEVYRRVGAKGGWTLHDARNDRDSALKLAQELMGAEKATGVKVVKETYNDETGDFLTLKIFEDGHNQVKLAPAQEDAPHALPCFKPADLYSYHARQTMTRLLADYLARKGLLDNNESRSQAARDDDEYDPDGFYLRDGPNNDQRRVRRTPPQDFFLF